METSKLSPLDKLWNKLQDFESDTHVVNYWDKRQSKIVTDLKRAENQFELETALRIIHQLSKSLNNREKYSSIFYIYSEAYRVLEPRFPTSSENLNETKYQLARGLHHIRKYDQSKRLFNELAKSGFDVKRIDNWWNQSTFASSRERLWIKTDILPALGRIGLLVVYVLLIIENSAFLITTVVFVVLIQLYESWWYYYKVQSYLRDYQNLQATVRVRRKIKKAILLELAVSLLFFPIYIWKPELYIPIGILVAVYFLTFHYGLNYYYLPKIIGDLNRKQTLGAGSH